MHKTFAALGDATRFALVQRLLEEGELGAGALQEGVDISAPAVSRHLRILRTAGVVQQRIDAQRRLYSVSPKALRAIYGWTMDHAAFWAGSLDRLEHALKEDDDA